MFGDNYLSHYGVKGMKWGVRRSASRLGKSIRSSFGAMRQRSRAASEKKKAEKKKAAQWRSQSLNEMSNAELTALLTRLDLEKRYRTHVAELTAKKPSMFQEMAKSMVDKGLKALGDKAVDSLMKRAFPADANKPKANKS